MDSSRQEKISRLLQKDLGEILQREAQGRLRNMLLTVTRVRVSPDLGIAKVYLSVFPSKNAAQIVKEMDDTTGYYRNLLAQKVRHQLRVIPQLQFYVDDSHDYIDNIDKLLK